MSGLTVAFWAAQILFSLAMILMGFSIWQKHKRGQEKSVLGDFWIASRRYKGWRMAASLAAGWLMLGWLGYGISMVYSMGISGLWTLFLPWFILCFIVVAIVPYVRRLRAVSLPEALEQRFGAGVRPLIAVCSIFVFVSWTGAETFMGGTLIAPFLHITPIAGMILMALPPMIYSYLGGFRASIITDLVQFILAAIFITALAFVGIHFANVTTGGQIIATLAKTPTVNYGAGTMFNLFACGVAMPIILLIAYLPGWLIEQDLLLRIQGAVSLKEAKKGAWWGLVFITIFVIIMPVLIGFSAIILFPAGAPTTAAAIGSDYTGIISAISLKYFPAWAQVLMLIGICASQMSTIDNFANIVALPMTHDIARPMFLRNASKETLAQWSRVLSFVAVVMGLIYGIYSTSLMDIYTLSSGVLTASIAVPAFAMFFKIANRRAVILSALGGLLGNVVLYIFEYKVWNHVFAPKWLADTYLGYIIVGIVCSLVGLIIGMASGKKSTPEQLAAIYPEPQEGMEVFEMARE